MSTKYCLHSSTAYPRFHGIVPWPWWPLSPPLGTLSETVRFRISTQGRYSQEHLGFPLSLLPFSVGTAPLPRAVFLIQALLLLSLCRCPRRCAPEAAACLVPPFVCRAGAFRVGSLQVVCNVHSLAGRLASPSALLVINCKLASLLRLMLCGNPPVWRAPSCGPKGAWLDTHTYIYHGGCVSQASGKMVVLLV